MKHLKHTVLILLSVILCFTMFSVAALAGTDAGGTGYGTNASYTDSDFNILNDGGVENSRVGYRFSWIRNAGDNTFARIGSIDIFDTTTFPGGNYTKHVIANVNGKSKQNLDKWSYKAFYRSTSIKMSFTHGGKTKSGYKYAYANNLDVTLPSIANASTVKTWLNSSAKQTIVLNAIKSGSTVSSLQSTDYLLMEPLYAVKIAKVGYTITPTEIALLEIYYNGGDTNGPSNWGGSIFKSYVNTYYPRSLILEKESEHSDLGIGNGSNLKTDSGTDKKAWASSIINYGYGVGVTWNHSAYKIKYVLDGGTLSPYDGVYTKDETKYQLNPTSTVYDGVPGYSAYFRVEHPTKTGYTFNGWDISNMDSCKHYYYNGGKIESTATSWDNTSIPGKSAYFFYNLRQTKGTVTFTANWTPNTYNIKYVLGSGGTLPSGTNKKSSTQYDDGYAQINPTKVTYDGGNYHSFFYVEPPTRAGYVFDGWNISEMDATDHFYYTSADGSVSFKTKTFGPTEIKWFKNLTAVNNDTVVFTAKWIPNTATVNVRKNDTAWNTTEALPQLWKNGEKKYSMTSSGNGKFTVSGVANGTYDIYAKSVFDSTNSWNKATYVDTGVNITVSNGNATANIDYYSVTLTGDAGITSANLKQGIKGKTLESVLTRIYLKNQLISFSADGAVKTGYIWNQWTLSSGSISAITYTRTTGITAAITYNATTTHRTYTATVNVRKNDTAWNTTAALPQLWQNDEKKYDMTSSGNGIFTASGVANGTYDIYAKSVFDSTNSWNKATYVDTGVNITISNGNATANIDYYTVKLTGDAGITTANLKQGIKDTTLEPVLTRIYLKDQLISFSADGAVKTGYAWKQWNASSGSTLSNITYTRTTGITAEITYTATTTANPYTNTLIYNANGGTGAPANQTATVTYPNTQSTFTVSTTEPTRSGYTFAGWYTTDKGGDKINETVIVGEANHTSNQSKTVYAHWITGIVTINIFKDNIAWDTTVAKPQLWQNGEKKYDMRSSSATSGIAGEFTASSVANGTYDIYAKSIYDDTNKWNKATYVDTGVNITVKNGTASANVNYYSATLVGDAGIDTTKLQQGIVGQALESILTRVYLKGQYVSFSADGAVKTGYTWKQWESNSDNKLPNITHNRTTGIKKPSIYTAITTPNTYNIQYILGDGGTLPSGNDTYIKYDGTAELQMKGRNDSAQLINPTKCVYNNTKPANFTIDDVQYTSTATNFFHIENPTRPGYTFKGWTVSGFTKDKNIANYWNWNTNRREYLSDLETDKIENTYFIDWWNLTNVNNGTVTFEARWEPKSYNITYKYILKGTNTVISTVNGGTYTYNVEKTLDTPTAPEGYNLVGSTWYATMDSTSPYTLSTPTTKIAAGSTDEKTFYINVTQLSGATVIYWKQPTSATHNYADYIKVYELEKDKSTTSVSPEYCFLGYHSAQTIVQTGESSFSYNSTVTVSIDKSKNDTIVNYYFDKNTCDVKYEFRGGTFEGSSNTYTRRYGITDVVTLIEPEWEGYTFTGWYYSVDNKNYVKYVGMQEDTFTVTKDITLYATWKKSQSDIEIVANPIYGDVMVGYGMTASATVINRTNVDYTSEKPLYAKLTIKDSSEKVYFTDITSVVVPSKNKNLVYFDIPAAKIPTSIDARTELNFVWEVSFTESFD